MRNSAFGSFVDKKKRDALKQLGLIKQMLESGGLKVENFLQESDTDDPYIFCFNSAGRGSFDGIRIYKIGNEIAFRVQKQNKTHPYGSAYRLPIEDMFQDFLSDEGSSQMKAGKMVIEAVVKEVKRFFQKSIEADKEEREHEFERNRDGNGNVLVRTTGTDYSAAIYHKT